MKKTMDLLERAESWIGEYLASERFRLLEEGDKERRESLLHAFFRELQASGVQGVSDLNGKRVAQVLLDRMPFLALEPGLKRQVPEFLDNFFEFLCESGQYPGAAAWQMAVEAEGARYQARIREDGSVRGETFKKNYTDVGRNDPCPCGSGKKFKKCCMPLIAG